MFIRILRIVLLNRVRLLSRQCLRMMLVIILLDVSNRLLKLDLVRLVRRREVFRSLVLVLMRRNVLL